MSEMGEKRWLVSTQPILMATELHLGNYARAEQIRQEIHQHLGQADHPMFLPAFLGLGLGSRVEGQLENARMYFQEGLTIAQRLRIRNFAAVMESELAHITRLSGDISQAKLAYRKLILTWKDFGQVPAVANMLECFAFIARAENQPVRAVRLLGAAQVVRRQVNALMHYYEKEEFDREVAALQTMLAETDFNQAWAQGSAMTLEQAVQFALEEEPENERP